ncbi:V-type H+-transporting ATPase [Pseudoscourfieldia marina]
MVAHSALLGDDPSNVSESLVNAALPSSSSPGSDPAHVNSDNDNGGGGGGIGGGGVPSSSLSVSSSSSSLTLTSLLLVLLQKLPSSNLPFAGVDASDTLLLRKLASAFLIRKTPASASPLAVASWEKNLRAEDTTEDGASPSCSCRSLFAALLRAMRILSDEHMLRATAGLLEQAAQGTISDVLELAGAQKPLPEGAHAGAAALLDAVRGDLEETDANDATARLFETLERHILHRTDAVVARHALRLHALAANAAHMRNLVGADEHARRSIVLSSKAARTPTDAAASVSAIASLAHALRIPTARPSAYAPDADVPALLRPLLVAGCADAVTGSTRHGGEQAAQLAQAAYDACICAWLLAFDADAASRLATAGCVAPLVALIRPGAAARPKVSRAATLAVYNLWFTAETGSAATTTTTTTEAHKPGNMDDDGPPVICEQLLRCGIAAAVADALRVAKGDPNPDGEHKANLERLNDATTTCAQRIADAASAAASRGADAAFEAYRREVLSGALGGESGEAPPTNGAEAPYGRFNARFWRVHAPSSMEQDDFALVRVLMRLLDPGSSADPTTLRLACHDLGQFATYHPHGRSVLRQLSAYGSVAQLLAHGDESVRRASLLCTQRIMLSRDAMDKLSMVSRN